MKKIIISFDNRTNNLDIRMVDGDYSSAVPSHKNDFLFNLINDLKIDKIVVNGSKSNIRYESGEVEFDNLLLFLDYAKKVQLSPEITRFTKSISDFMQHSMEENLETARKLREAEEKKMRIAAQIEEAKRRQEEVKAATLKSEGKLADVDARLSEALQTLEKVKKQKEEAEEKYLEFVSKRTECEEAKDSIEHQISLAKKRKVEIEEQIKALEAEILEVDLRTDDAKIKRANIEMQISALEKEKDELESEISGESRALDALMKQIDDAKKELYTLKGQIVSAKLELVEIENQIKNAKDAKIVDEISISVSQRLKPSLPSKEQSSTKRESNKKHRFKRIASIAGRIIGGVVVMGIAINFAYNAAAMVINNFEDYRTYSDRIITSANIEYYVPYDVSENVRKIDYSYNNSADMSVYDECWDNYHNLFKKYANMYGLDERIVLAIAANAGGVHFVDVNGDGRIGLMNLDYYQMVNDSVAAYNYETNEYEIYPVNHDNIKEIDTNVKIGCMYYQFLYRRYNYNHLLALEAYFYGNEYVDNLLQSLARQAGMSVSDYLKETDNSIISEYFTEDDGSIFAYDILSYIPNDNILEFKTVIGNEVGANYYFTFNNTNLLEIGQIKNT